MKLGPLLLPYTALLLLIVAMVSFAVARYFDRRNERNIETSITIMFAATNVCRFNYRPRWSTRSAIARRFGARSACRRCRS